MYRGEIFFFIIFTAICNKYLVLQNIMFDKRDRGSNFTENDRELLLTIVSENFFKIIENKKTDGVTIKEKNDAWGKVAVNFNSSTTNTQRTATQLKQAYNNIKRKLKKENADEKVEIYKTGGGPHTTPKITDSKARLLNLLKSQIEPLQNLHDSSADYLDTNVAVCFDENQRSSSVGFIEGEIPTITETDMRIDGKRSSFSESLMSTQEPAAKTLGTSTKTGTSVINKKRKLVDVYNRVDQYVKEKMNCKDNIKRQNEIQYDILMLKKKKEQGNENITAIQLQQEQVKLEQENLKKKQEIKLKILEEELKIKILQREKLEIDLLNRK